jgi:hypothetical protein
MKIYILTATIYKFHESGGDEVDCDIITEAGQRDDDVDDDAVIAVLSRNISKRIRENEE